MMAVCKKCKQHMFNNPIEIEEGSFFCSECIDSVKSLVKIYIKTLIKSKKENVYISPNIPQKKVYNAINSYAPYVLDSQVIALYDSTVFGSAKEGLLITGAAFYYKKYLKNPIQINFNEIKSLQMKWESKKVKNKIYEKRAKLKIEIYSENSGVGKIYIICFNDDDTVFDLEKFNEFLQKILDLKKSNKVDETDKFIIIEDMPEETKLNYAKIIVNFTYQDDDIIDAKELSELQLLMTQLKFNPELRIKIRNYISNPSDDIKELIYRMDKTAPRGSQHPLHISLLKDLMRVARKTKKKDEIDRDIFLLKILKMFNISKNQLDVIQDTIKYDEMLIKGHISENELKKYAKNIAANASAVGLPLAAVYLSGSVVGLSAAGITSGLATIGLGGLFGLSSMVTGVGAVIIIGAGAYKGIQWLFGENEKSEEISKREYMIQEIIRLQQETISYLATDINSFAMQLVKLAKESQMNKKMIEKISKELSVFTNAMNNIKDRAISRERVMNET
jgi:hypothetical protein